MSEKSDYGVVGCRHMFQSESGRANPPEQDMTSLSPANAERLKLAFQECRNMEGTLNERLGAYAAAGRQIFPAYGEAVDRLVARIHENGGGENAPRPGDVMPPFILPDVTGRLIDLKSLLENGPVAVMFYRGHWCPYCRLNVGAVVQALENFHGNDGWVLPIPATFVVGRDGLVKARFVDPDFRKRMEIDDLIAAFKTAN